MTAFIVLFVTLLILASLLSRLVGDGFAGVLLSVIGIILGLNVRECRDLLKKFDNTLTQIAPLAGLTAFARRLKPALTYLDLAVLLTSTFLLNVAIFDAFVFSVEDLRAKGFVAFPNGDDGFVHLQIYLGGFVFLPNILLCCGGFGFLRGFRDRSISFLKLFMAIFLGVIGAVILLTAMRGTWTSIANYQTFARPNTLPTGATPVVAVVKIGVILVFLVAMDLYTWLFGKAGQLSRWAYEKLKLNSSV